MLVTIYRFMTELWFDPIKWLRWIKSLYRYGASYFVLKKNARNKDFLMRPNFPCLHDKDDFSGTVKGHYYHQDLFVAQKIFARNPSRHIDIWSRVDGFVAHVASFREIEVLDIRVLESKSQNIVFTQGDLMWDMSTEYIACTDSLSCLHTLEHFGLWRYWDMLDYDGHIRWFQQMTKILKPWWIFYFSTPISYKQRIEFNAHRVFSLSYLLEKLFDQNFDILSFSYVDDRWDLHKDVQLDTSNIQSCFNLHYGCGIFELRKK